MNKSDKVKNVIASIKTSFMCAICLEIVSNPVSTKCSHYFCSKCITDYLAKPKRKGSTCPLCKTSITKRSITPNTKLEKLLKAVENLCEAVNKDCFTASEPDPLWDFSTEPRRPSSSLSSKTLGHSQNSKDLDGEVIENEKNDKLDNLVHLIQDKETNTNSNVSNKSSMIENNDILSCTYTIENKENQYTGIKNNLAENTKSNCQNKVTTRTFSTPQSSKKNILSFLKDFDSPNKERLLFGNVAFSNRDLPLNIESQEYRPMHQCGSFKNRVVKESCIVEKAKPITASPVKPKLSACEIEINSPIKVMSPLKRRLLENCENSVESMSQDIIESSEKHCDVNKVAKLSVLQDEIDNTNKLLDKSEENIRQNEQFNKITISSDKQRNEEKDLFSQELVSLEKSEHSFGKNKNSEELIPPTPPVKEITKFNLTKSDEKTLSKVSLTNKSDKALCSTFAKFQKDKIFDSFESFDELNNKSEKEPVNKIGKSPVHVSDIDDNIVKCLGNSFTETNSKKQNCKLKSPTRERIERTNSNKKSHKRLKDFEDSTSAEQSSTKQHSTKNDIDDICSPPRKRRSDEANLLKSSHTTVSPASNDPPKFKENLSPDDKMSLKGNEYVEKKEGNFPPRKRWRMLVEFSAEDTTSDDDPLDDPGYQSSGGRKRVNCNSKQISPLLAKTDTTEKPRLVSSNKKRKGSISVKKGEKALNNFSDSDNEETNTKSKDKKLLTDFPTDGEPYSFQHNISDRENNRESKNAQKMKTIASKKPTAVFDLSDSEGAKADKRTFIKKKKPKLHDLTDSENENTTAKKSSANKKKSVIQLDSSDSEDLPKLPTVKSRRKVEAKKSESSTVTSSDEEILMKPVFTSKPKKQVPASQFDVETPLKQNFKPTKQSTALRDPISTKVTNFIQPIAEVPSDNETTINYQNEQVGKTKPSRIPPVTHTKMTKDLQEVSRRKALKKSPKNDIIAALKQQIGNKPIPPTKRNYAPIDESSVQEILMERTEVDFLPARTEMVSVVESSNIALDGRESSINAAEVQEPSMNVVEGHDSPSASVSSDDDNSSKLPVMVTSRLNKKQNLYYSTMCQKLNVGRSQECTDDVTHLIINTDEKGYISKESYTFKYLLALVSRIWIVGFKWVMECSRKSQLIPEGEFEVKGDSSDNHDDIPRKYRTARKSQRKLLHGLHVCILGDLSRSPINKDQFTKLILKLGAKIVTRITQLKSAKDLIITDNVEDVTSVDKELMEKKGLYPLHPEWLVQSIINFKLADKEVWRLQSGARLI